MGEGEVGKAEGRGPGGLPLGEPTRAGGEEERVAGGGSEVVEDVLASGEGQAVVGGGREGNVLGGTLGLVVVVEENP